MKTVNNNHSDFSINFIELYIFIETFKKFFHKCIVNIWRFLSIALTAQVDNIFIEISIPYFTQVSLAFMAINPHHTPKYSSIVERA